MRATVPYPILGTVLLCGALLVGCVRARGPLKVGESIPLDISGPALVWAFDASRCFGCTLTESAREIRRVQRRFETELIVIAITDQGDQHEPLVTSFLRAERLTAQLELRSLLEYAARFGFNNPEPVVYVVDDGTIIQIVDGLDPMLIDHVEALVTAREVQ